MSDTVPMETDTPAQLAAADTLAPQIALDDVELNIPTIDNKVYKDECLYCFNSPFSHGGIFISTKSFFAVCPEHIETLISEEKNKGFVSLKKKKILIEQEEPKDKIQKLSIKLDVSNEIEEYNFVVYPNLDQTFVISESTLPSNVYACVNAIVTHTSAAIQERLEAGVSEWDGEQRIVSENALNLIQAENPRQIPYNGWECEEPGCGLTENLWLNFTDGAIMCGRFQMIDANHSIPGNGHAKIYYEKTKYPIVVKLGTIHNGDADVYDYIIDDAVKDPKLAEHLAHFGLDINKMEKTEKSTLEMELDLNQKWEWSRCLEDGVSLESVYGPHFTGIINIGSSCYINSVLQMLYIIPDFIKIYGGKTGANYLYSLTPNQINEDFNAQLSKILLALESGNYSKKDCEDLGFKPTQFRKIVGRGHVEFSTARQQDAEEYLRHLLDKVDNNATGEYSPADSLRFQLETKLKDESSGYVRYSDREDIILPLQIPIEQANDVIQGNGPSTRKIISLDTILDYAFGEEKIEGFKSPVNDRIGNAITKIAMKTFPDYLVLQIKRFGYTENHSIKKLDVDVMLDQIIDLDKYRGKGPQPDENLLPDDVNADIGPKVNEEWVAAISDMGFSQNASRKAVYVTKNSSLEAATEWVMQHMTDPDFEEVHPDLRGSRKRNDVEAKNPKVLDLEALGFPAHKAEIALKNNGGDVNAAAEWLFMNGDSLPDEPMENTKPTVQKQFRDGHGRYRVRAIISHMGSSPHTGHYVAHIQRDGKWYLFNDEKVAVSQNPPLSLGYLYLLERISQ